MTSNDTHEPSGPSPDATGSTNLHQQATNKPSSRRVIAGIAAGVAVFALTAGASWAVTRDGAPTDTAAEESSIPPAPRVDENGNLIPVDGDATGESVFALLGSRTIDYDEAFDVIPARAVLGADDDGTGPIIFDTPIEGLTTDALRSSGDGADDSGTTPTTTPPTSTTIAGRVDDDPVMAPGETLSPSVAWRFVDPCADAPERCSDLGDALRIGATVLPHEDVPAMPPVRITSLTMSTGKSEGCSTGEVPAGHRAVGVVLNRPAGLSLQWSRMGAPAGGSSTVVPDRAAIDEYRENPTAGWTTCIDTTFPAAEDNSAALLYVTATGADGTTDRKSMFSHDDDARRLHVFTVGKANEVVAMAPKVGDVRLAAVALTDEEDEVAGCARASLRVLPNNPAPGTSALRGEELNADDAAALAPGDGEWVGARFTALGEAERYAVCMFSLGRARGNLNGGLEATDAVFVQPPNRERYEIQPVRWQRKLDPRRSWFQVAVGEGTDRCSWTRRLTVDDPAEHDMGEESAPCQLGRLDIPEQTIGSVFGPYEKTSTAYITMPAHCTGYAQCQELREPKLYSLDAPGPSYSPTACGAAGASCDGVRPRGVLEGTVTLSVRAVESPVGPEFWTFGTNKRVDVNIPAEHYELIDYLHSSLMIDHAGRVIIRLHALVPVDVTVYPLSCDGGVLRMLEPMESFRTSQDFTFYLPDPIAVGQCMTASIRATDPTHAREDNTNGMMPQIYREY